MTASPSGERPGAKAGEQRDQQLLYNALVGAEQKFLIEYQKFVTQVGSELSDPLTQEWRDALQSDGRWKREPVAAADADEADLLSEVPSRAVCAAEAVSGLALALTQAAGVDLTVPAAVVYAERANLIDAAQSAAQWPPFEVSDAAASVLTKIRSTRSPRSPSAGFLTLLALYLTDAFPPVAGHRHPLTVRVNVLFGREAGQGSTGELALHVLASGPPGLHPDPQAMTFTELDEAVIDAAASAWKTSAFAGTDACVIWSVTENLVPCDHVFGNSLGAAFAVGLDELAPRKWRPRMLRSRFLDDTCAITGKVTGSQLEAVGAYKEKLNAAKRAKLRVVAPSHNFPKDLPPDLAGHVKLKLAGSVHDAVRLSRAPKLNRNFLIAWAIVVVALLVGSVTLVWARAENAREIAAETQRRVAADLANSSTSTDLDPRAAALQALASYQLDPTVAARTAMRTIAERYEWVAHNTPATGSAVTAIVAAPDRTYGEDRNVFTVDRNGDLRVLTLPDLTVTAVVHPDLPITQLALGKVDDTNVLLGVNQDGITVYDLVPGRPPVWRTNLTAPGFDPGSVVRIATDDTGAVATVSHSSIVSWDLHTGKAVSYPVSPAVVYQNPDATVDIVAAAAEIGYDDGEKVVTFALDDRVWKLQIQTGALRYVTATNNNLKITSLSRSLDDRLAVGTADGVFLEGKVRVEGVHGTVNAVTWSSNRNADLLASTTTGTFVVPQPGADGSAAGTQQLPAFGAQLSAVAPISGARWVIARADGSLAIIDPTNQALTQPSVVGGSNAVAFTPDGNLLVTRSTGYTNDIRDIVELDITSGTDTSGNYAQIGDSFSFPNTPSATHLPFVNDLGTAGGFVFASGMDGRQKGRVWVWNADNHALVAELPFEANTGAGADEPDIVTQVRIDPNHHQLIAYNVRSGQLAFWSTDDWSPLAILATGPGGDLSLAPGGDSIAIVSNVIEDAPTTADQTSTSASPPGITSAPDSTTANPTSTDHITFIDTETRTIQPSPTPLHNVIRVAFSPDGSTLAALTTDSLQLLGADGSPDTDGPAPLAMDTLTSEITWSPDGKIIALTRSTQGMLLVDAATLAPVAAPLLALGRGQISSAAWNPDGTVLAVTALDRSQARSAYTSLPTQLWTPTATTWAGQMCTIAGSEFTPTEWDTNVGGGIEFQHLCPGDPGDVTAERQPDCFSPSLISRFTTPETPSWVRCVGDAIVAGAFRGEDGTISDGIRILHQDGNGKVQTTATILTSSDGSTITDPAAAPFVADTNRWQAYNTLARQVIDSSETFTHDGLGQVQIGMTKQEAFAADPTLAEYATTYVDGSCSIALGVAYDVTFNSAGQLSSIRSHDKFGTRTVDGAQVGDTIARLREIYGKSITTGFAGEVELANGNFYEISTDATTGLNSFVEDTDHVTAFELKGGNSSCVPEN